MLRADKNQVKATALKTRLSRLHPYPAMVADELAVALVEKFIPTKSAVMDPFCGSGRLLAAVENAKLRVGIDTNPLAWLLTKTKLSAVDPAKIMKLGNTIEQARLIQSASCLDLASDRKVPWFSARAKNELACIVEWINGLQLDEPELLLLGSVLSATTRDVSYARQGGWKLHRLNADAREKLDISAWDSLKKRLMYCCTALKSGQTLEGPSYVEIGDSRDHATFSNTTKQYGLFDVVITSPPYGDSLSTVQYGAASSLSLEVVGYLKGLEHLPRAGKTIDGTCLGGGTLPIDMSPNLNSYWVGSNESSRVRPIAKFLYDYDLFCKNVAACLRVGGKAILVVGRRSTGGALLNLDDFTVDCFESLGFSLTQKEVRPLTQKRFPSKINRFARSKSAVNREHGQVTTMQNEIILVLEKTC